MELDQHIDELLVRREAMVGAINSLEEASQRHTHLHPEVMRAIGHLFKGIGAAAFALVRLTPHLIKERKENLEDDGR